MKILITGDYCPQNRVAKLIAQEKYGTFLSDVKKIVDESDYALINLECPVTEQTTDPILKYGPALRCNRMAVAALSWAGFNCTTLANNHLNDYGVQGIKETLRALNDYHLDFVGVGVNLEEASRTLYKRINDKILAIVNCCEHEFSIATDSEPGANPLNPISQYYAIKEAKNKADFVLVIVHGGHEHYNLPSIRMQDTYRFFIDAGADSVINHHQHCYSGYELYNDRPIFYGLGNFCFDYPIAANNSSNWGDGYMVMLDLGDKINFKIYPYYQFKSSPTIECLPQNTFDKELERLNSIVKDREMLKNKQECYYASEEKNILLNFQPYRNKFYLAACRRGLLPTYISKKWQVVLYNMFFCESHFDKVKYFVANYKNIFKNY